MLIQILIHQPQMLGTAVRNTPPWVWGLLGDDDGDVDLGHGVRVRRRPQHLKPPGETS